MTHTPSKESKNTEQWEEEFREYFDKTLKPKKPTMGNLDRELVINFMKSLITQAEERGKKCCVNGCNEERNKYCFLHE